MDTILEFVGLCVFTSQVVSGLATERVSNSARIRGNVEWVAILPRVDGSTMPASMASSHSSAPRQAPATTPASRSRFAVEVANPGPAVEAHLAMIAFRSCDLLSVDGWAVKSLGDKDYLYIELSGEHLTFVADAPNGAVTPTREGLPLAKLGGTLTAPFTPPAYSGAAAVFTIPKGKLSTCAKPADNGNRARVDTTLTLNTTSKLTIVAAGKSVTLRAGQKYYIGNIPRSFLETHQSMESGPMHYEVYCAMTGATDCPRVKRLLFDSQGNGPCQSDFVVIASHVPGLILDFACSNSQWP